MAYATQADLEKMPGVGAAKLIELTDCAGSGAADSVIILQALDDASAVIDGYIAGRYALPLSVVPDLIKTWCCVLTRHALYPNGVPEFVRTAYEDAVAQLRDVARGHVTLTIPGIGSEPAASPAGGVRGSSAPRVFDRATLEDYTR